MPKRRKTSAADSDAVRIADAIGRLANALEKQNLYHRRFLNGLIFGVGTAIGASVIATLIIVTLSRVFSLVGIANFLDPSFGQQVLEEQIESQTPPSDPL